ncbi:MAG: hypothetical protein GY772_18045, partial [bacterium]|nr:hypothetical protein [bacterium]
MQPDAESIQFSAKSARRIDPDSMPRETEEAGDGYHFWIPVAVLLEDNNLTPQFKADLLTIMRADQSAYEEQQAHPGITEAGKWFGLACLPADLQDDPPRDPLSETVG